MAAHVSLSYSRFEEFYGRCILCFGCSLLYSLIRSSGQSLLDADVTYTAASYLLISVAKLIAVSYSFHINGSTGVVTVADGRALDAETTSTYLFTVEASDDNGAIGQAQVTLICMDVNDNAPRFLRHLPELSFKEFSEEDIPEGPIIKFEVGIYLFCIIYKHVKRIHDGLSLFKFMSFIVS